MPLSIIVALANRPQLSDDLVAQLGADGHDVHQAHHSRHATALLAGRYVDVLMLGALERLAATLTLLRELRAAGIAPFRKRSSHDSEDAETSTTPVDDRREVWRAAANANGDPCGPRRAGGSCARTRQ